MKFIKGIFLKRLNRFTCKCLVDNKKVKAYLPNPGRLWEILLPKRILYLEKINKKNTLPYIIWGAEKDGDFILLNTNYTNELAEKLIKENKIKDLTGKKIIKREAKIKNRRIDFLLKDNNKERPLEVKSCTLFYKKIAFFPDAVSERARNHLYLLAENNGYLLLIIYSPKIYYFLPDFHTDFAFAFSLYKLRKKIKIKAVSVKVDKDLRCQFIREVKIPWKVFERFKSDRGNYLLVGELKKDKKILVGKLGRIIFKKGYYVYVGRAMENLEKRIERHLRRKKKKRWHIDYLVDYLVNLKVISIRSERNFECEIAKDLEKINFLTIKKFGSSDCLCESHLYYSPTNPFLIEDFVNLINKYRFQPLLKYLY
uniref:DNA/RNA nuclease SfsA n=1 Tax=candidate division WOR-3 bacterium TaxID=2052148 RepID=A0A7V3ZVE7_UNCW3